MQPITYYGIICTHKDEKNLLNGINGYLKTLKRSTSKVKDGSMLENEPFKLKHFYWNLNKDTGTWMDLKPNQDLNGEWRFPGDKECGWIVHVRFDASRLTAGTEEQAKGFINSLLESTGFQFKVIREEDKL